MLLLILIANDLGFPEDDPPFINPVQAIEPERTGLSNPSGLAISSLANNFYMFEAIGYNPVVSDVIVIKMFPPWARCWFYPN